MREKHGEFLSDGTPKSWGGHSRFLGTPFGSWRDLGPVSVPRKSVFARRLKAMDLVSAQIVFGVPLGIYHLLLVSKLGA